jgi:hypothetical protein
MTRKEVAEMIYRIELAVEDKKAEIKDVLWKRK